LKFSYRWMSELVPGLHTDPADLQRLITMKTAECEGIEPVGAHFASVVAARVVSVDPLPKGKNKAVVIETGRGRQKRVVCGAPNVRPGVVAPWVPPGTMLEGKTITSAVIEGVESEGMLASAAELGIGRDHSGILELDGTEPGRPLAGLAADWIIEIDNKSLTHRPDLWGHYGIAREVAAISRLKLKNPVQVDVLPPAAPVVKVSIEDFELCSRYSALVIENIKVGPAPLWLQARLESVGLNSINNVVDVTNYVLAELPQPMHAFDADKLQGDTIFIRKALRGERLAALNGETYDLHPRDLVIADASGPIALAGVIGGSGSAISESSTRVVLESANFQASSVRLTSARHRLRTDASMRFEKALDPENTVAGLARAVALLREVCPGIQVRGGVSDRRAQVQPIPPIALSTEFVARKLGVQVTQAQITEILTALGFGVQESAPGVLTVIVPSWRATKDISLKDDLVEEIGRMIGYGEITPAPPTVAAVPPPANPERSYQRQVRFQLAAQGFTEAYNYSFVNEADVKKFSFRIEEHLAVRNPIASELTHLRRSLLPGLFENVVSNTRHSPDFRMFEIGSEIHPGGGTDLPNEPVHLVAALYNLHANVGDLFELKRVLECLFPGVRLKPTSALPYEHPTRTAEAEWHGTLIGRLFEIHPSLLRAEGIDGRAMFFDVDLTRTQELLSRRTKMYKPLRKYPTSGFDLSIIADIRTPVAAIEDDLRSLAGERLASIEFVTEYSGPPFPEGRKSVSYHLEVGSLDHTLTAEEAAEIRSRIIDGMQGRGYGLRI
jgi:phenylalanyl-tRNA synthetase beta chain